MNLLQKYSLKTRVTLIILVIFMTSSWLLATYVSQALRNDMQRLLGEQQFSTVSFIAAEVNYELNDRLKMLAKVAANISPGSLDNVAALQALLERQPVLQDQFSGGVIAYRPDGTAIAELPRAARRIGVNYIDVDTVASALIEGKSTIGHPVMGKKLAAPILNMTVPVRNAQGKVIGALGGSINLGKPGFLNKIAEGHYAKTGGYLLVARQQRLIVTATDKSRIMETLPPPGAKPLLERFMQGYEGSGIAVNPQGVEMLVSGKGIPVADWIMLTVLPTAEAFAPVHAMQQRIWLATLFLTVLAGSLTWWMLRRELFPMLAAAKTLVTLSDTNQPPQPLPVARCDEIGQLIGGLNRLLGTLGKREDVLKKSEAFMQAILNSIADEIAVLDRDGVILAVNEPWRRFTLENAMEPDTLVANADIGSNYLTACKMSRGLTWEADVDACDGIRAVLGGRISSFNLEYPCHSPQQQRWFSMSVTPLGGAVRGGAVIAHKNISERKLAEVKLVESELLLRTIIENEPECIKITDAHGCLIQMNPAGLAIIEADSLEQVIGRQILDIIAPEYCAAYAELHKRVLAGESMQMQYVTMGLKGGRRWLETNAVPMQYHGQTVHLAVTRDITERKQAEEKLHLAASVFTHAREGISITDAGGKIIDVNDTFTRITGYSRDEVLGCNPSILKSGHQGKEFYAAMWRDLIERGHWYGEIWNRRKNGEVYAEMLTIGAVRDAQGSTQQYVALFSDITVLKEHEKQLEHIAHYDALTTLPNRVLLADRLHQAMAQVQRSEQRLAVAYLDLDGFKNVNDSHGHEVGDQLLMIVASRMKEALREGDTLARLGGDEFVAVLFDLSDIEASVPVLTRMLAAVAKPVCVSNHVFQVSASLGVTFYPQVEDVDADQLLRQADQAMYQAKLAGKNRYHVFDAEHDRSVRVHHESLEHIRRALAEQEFVLHYQPKVNMRTGMVIGAEALIRWQHPEKGLLAPALFLPAIEDHPLAIELGEWVIDSAMTQMELWHAVGLDIPVSVNIGARQLQQSDFVERLCAILAAHPEIKPSCIELEVLETSALEDLARASRVIEDCRKIGVMFALDDFGTGYSSLTYLKHLPVTLLKIDQSFVRGMLDDPDDLAILGGVLGLATAFRRKVIAEGVETTEHGVMLLQLGCELAQGYGIARPMPAHELPGWAATWQPDQSWIDTPAVSRDDLSVLYAGVEHRAWIMAIGAFLRGEREAPPALNHHQCRFGNWLDADGMLRYGSQTVYRAIESLHRQVHMLAAELLELQAKNRNHEALTKLDQLHVLRDDLLIQLKTLARGNRK